MNAPPASAARAPRHFARLAGSLAALAAFVVFCTFAWRETFPSLPTRLTLQITFPPGIANTAEPLVATGVRGAGDLLAVKYLDASTGVFVYDAWAVGGPVSPPFALEPGKPRTLDLELPTLAIVRGPKPRDTRPLRVALDGQELLRADVYYHRREPANLSFAANHIGGTIAGETFRGELATSDGQVLRGGPETIVSWPTRVPRLLTARPPRLALDLLLSAAVGLVVAAAMRFRFRRWPTPVFPAHATPPHRAFAATAALCTLVFVTVLTGGTFRLIFPESFGNFYDHQAASLLAGRLDVPEAALHGEAFVFEGKIYGYFGPTPALLRLPFTALGVAFGQLSRSFMVGYFVACLLGVYALLLHAQRLATGPATWPSRFNTVALTAIAGLGTTLFFTSSRAYIYHEAILCGAAFALWASVFALRWFATAHRNLPWLAALACGVASVHARPPIGLFALSMLGCTALALTFRALFPSTAPAAPRPSSSPSRLRTAFRPFMIAVLAGFGVLSFNALSYLKFKSFDGAPLRYHVQYHPERLANIEGKNFHLSNIPFNFGSYFWRPDFEFRRAFPYFFIKGADPHINPESRLDLAEPVAAMPYSMPAAFFLAVFGGILAWRRWPASRWPLGIVLGALAPMTAALLTAVAVSQRYTGDFVPGLLAAAAFGLVAHEVLSPRTRLAARILIVIVVVTTVPISLAITLHYQGEGVWGVSDDIKHRYESIRASFDGFFGSPPRAR